MINLPTKEQIAELRDKVKREYTCVPENSNLNTLKCKHCGRTWWFEEGARHRTNCPKQVSFAAHQTVPNLLEAAEMLIDLLEVLSAARARNITRGLNIIVWQKNIDALRLYADIADGSK